MTSSSLKMFPFFYEVIIILSKSPYSFWIKQKTDQKKLLIWTHSHASFFVLFQTLHGRKHITHSTLKFTHVVSFERMFFNYKNSISMNHSLKQTNEQRWRKKLRKQPLRGTHNSFKKWPLNYWWIWN